MKKITAAVAVALALASAGGAQPAAAGVGFTVTLENPYAALGSVEERVIRLDVTTPPVVDVPRPHRLPLNLALVIDRSGSMASEAKLAYAIDAACRIVDSLRPGDRIAVVTYDHRVEVPAPSQVVEDQWHLKRILRRLRPGGNTNLGGGLQEGLRQVARRRSGRQVNRVILLSDGLANTGITDPRRLREIVSNHYGDGITVSTFGVGADFNEYLMTSLARSGGGRYYFIAEPAQIPEQIAAEFDEAVHTVALSARIVLHLTECELASVSGYPYRREGSDFVIDLGDLPLDQRRRIMITLRPRGRTAGRRTIGSFSLEYRPADGRKELVSLRRPVALTFTDDRARIERSYDQAVRTENEVVQNNIVIDEASRLLDDGKEAAAMQILKSQEEKLESLPQDDRVRGELRKNRDYQQAVKEAPAMSEPKKKLMQKRFRKEVYERTTFY